jgi:DNA-binding transcriptional regulator YiaG
MNIKTYITQKQRTNIPTIGKLGKLSGSDFNRIINKIEGNPSINDCWLWSGTMDYISGKGHCHGNIWYNQNFVKVHRIMYHNFIEDVPIYDHKDINLIVLHKCSHINDGRCVNPVHLKLGLPNENTRDAMKSNTLTLMKSNEENPMSKLSNNQITEIRALKGTGLTQREVAERYNINPSQISRYWNNKTRKLI